MATLFHDRIFTRWDVNYCIRDSEERLISYLPSIESVNIGCIRTTGDKVRAGGDREQATATCLELERHHPQDDRNTDQ